MKLLLDTHTFVWADIAPEQLSDQVKLLLQDRGNAALLSVVSVWEMQIKHQLGKMSLDMPLAEMIYSQQRTNDVEILNVMLPHVIALDELPLHHRDPFDRLLIAQANSEDAVLVSKDSIFSHYPVNVIW